MATDQVFEAKYAEWVEHVCPKAQPAVSAWQQAEERRVNFTVSRDKNGQWGIKYGFVPYRVCIVYCATCGIDLEAEYQAWLTSTQPEALVDEEADFEEDFIDRDLGLPDALDTMREKQ